MTDFLFEFLLIFVLAKLLADLCERFGQPGLIGEILAGAVLGPGVLNWVHPNQVLTTLSELGVMFLLFRVGLDVKPSLLFKAGKIATLVAFGGVAVPLLTGWIFLPFFGMSQIEAIFMGAAMVATSVGITAQVLSSKGLLSEQSSQVILAAAVIDDVLGLLVLVFVDSLAEKKVQVSGLLSAAFLACAFTFIVARFGSPLINRAMPRVQRLLSVREAEFHAALVVVFSLSVLASYIGIAAIVGAFLAGLAFSEAADRRVKDLFHGVTELLLPFFLVGIGLQLDISSLKNSRTMILAIGLTLAALLTKLIGCGLPALLLGKRQALQVGVGMIPRGEVGIVVAQIGFGMKILRESDYAAVVFMAMATTVLAPPLLGWAFAGCEPRVSEESFNLS